MYRQYFKLKEKPFPLESAPHHQLYLSSSHNRAIQLLRHGIRENAGFALLTGETGSGKTALINSLAKQLDSKVPLARVFNTKVSSLQLIGMINDDLGIETLGRNKAELLKDLNDFLVRQHANGPPTLLIIDEAQNLPPDQLEEIRMLSNLETCDSKLIQIILVGQPELRDTLALPQLRQLRQRISINCRITPLTRVELPRYILHHLDTAGNMDAVSFSEDSFSAIFHYTRGIPRLVNIICNFLLLTAFAEETRKVEVSMVLDIEKELDFQALYWGDKVAGPPRKHADYSVLLHALGIGAPK